MAEYLFVYPILDYFDDEVENCAFEMRGGDPRKMMRIIDARYRNNGYGINWLFFGKHEDPSVPDVDSVSEFVEIREEDRILCSGVLLRPVFRDFQYPDPHFILDQLPSHKRLVLGGFHQQDCVDRIARASHERGIDTFVDEDTTNLFFDREVLTGIPLIRTTWSLLDLVCCTSYKEYYYEVAKELRKGKPWLVQE